MRRLKLGVAGLAAVSVAAVVPLGFDAGALTRATGEPTDYVVVYHSAAAAKAAHAAIEKAGGTIQKENSRIGTALVRSTDPNFAKQVRRGGAVLGAAHNRPLGKASGPARSLVERLSPADRAAAAKQSTFEVPVAKKAPKDLIPGTEGTPTAPEPLSARQWNMAMIGATSTGSYAKEPGDKRVRVGIIDTGVDATHPDISPNFDAVASRNFVTDIPDTDGPCEAADCKDPVGTDDNGHGTHAASVVASPINGLGVAGVAPGVTLVDLRAGQDSGFFFLQPVVDAITYAGDAGINVINMSFFVDPWLFNCTNNPSDTPEQQTEQKTIVEAVQRAVDYAIGKGVLPVGSMGNESTDLGFPTKDDKSPGFPVGTARERSIDNNCLNVPTETDGVLSISSLGPSGRKAYYSNYGLEQTDFAAPGGDAFDTPDGKVNPTAQILAAYPEKVGRAIGDIDAAGEPTTPFVVKDCKATVCAYYQYLQGTSMASPHAAGVAALAVSRFGRPTDGNRLTMEPKAVEETMALGADRRSCPKPAEQTYTINSADGQRTIQAKCDQDFANSGFYGRGVVGAETLLVLPKLTPGSGTAPAPAPAPAPTEPPAPPADPAAPPAPAPTAPAEQGELPNEEPPSAPPPADDPAPVDPPATTDPAPADPPTGEPAQPGEPTGVTNPPADGDGAAPPAQAPVDSPPAP